MNKWQIICPVVALLVAGMVFSSWQARNERKAMQGAIESQLGAVLTELERLQEGGRFPSLQAAQRDLNDEAVARRVHTTSLFGTDDLFYNPSQPLVSGDALVLCARVDRALVAIYADRKVHILGDAELRQAGLVPLADTPSKTKAKPGGSPDVK